MISNCNKYKALDTDLVKETTLVRNSFSIRINAGEEIVPVTKVSVSVQTDETIPKETKVNIFPYLCFYCEDMINSNESFFKLPMRPV